MKFLRIDSISKQYRKHVALKNVSFSIPQSSIFGLLGPNGAGKTTLIRIINQIIEADTGDIWMNDEKLSSKHIASIGYLPEERGLYKKMKVSDQLLFLAQLRGMKKKIALQKAKEWCEKLDIMAWWNRKIEDLSKGMAQKIQFIATVLHKPDLIILDEPFSGFDPVNANLIKTEILKLREQGSTIIFSTHRMESVEQLCDYVVLINHAEKVLEGSKEEIKEKNREGKYIIEYQNTLQNFDDFSVISTQNKGVRFVSEIQYDKDKPPNQLLQKLMSQVEIFSFKEKIPSINDIFIAHVTPTSPHA